jgi:hypothetical protein
MEDLTFFAKALVLFYEDIIEKHNIEAVLAHHTDNAHSAMLFEMCLSLRTVAFLIFPDYYWEQGIYYLFDDKYFISSHITELYHRNMQEFDRCMGRYMDDIEDYLNHRTSRDPSNERKKLLGQLSLSKNFVNVLKVLNRSDVKFYFRKPDVVEGYGQVHVPTSIRAFLIRTGNIIRNKITRIYARDLPDEPYVYLPLQRVPEAAMLSRATAFFNQQGLAQTISAALPMGFRLVIKDHPRSVGVHSPGYYKKLLELPNVIILHPAFPNHRILEGASLVITIAGTLGFQQLLNGKPVVMLGRKYYESLEGAIKVSDLNALPYVLKRILLFHEKPGRVEMRKSLYSFIAAMLEARYVMAVDNERLHKDSEAFAELVAMMVEREVEQLYEQTVLKAVKGTTTEGRMKR